MRQSREVTIASTDLVLTLNAELFRFWIRLHQAEDVAFSLFAVG
jgi:hypothetical protein